MGTRREHGDDGHDEREVERRLRALADEPLPASTRERHLARLEQTPPAAGRAVRRGRGRVPRRAIPVLAAMLLLLVVSGGGAVAAAQDATPDDALYGVKRASEEVWVAMPRGSERAAQVQLTLAMRRHGEAMRAPGHAERLLAAGAEHAENAAEELPEEAFETFQRLLGDGEDALPAHASPRAHAAIHRNCMRLADRHPELDAGRCGTAPDDAHPGRGMGSDGHPGRGMDPDGHPGRGMGDGHPGGPRDWADGERPGWGPDGRPDDYPEDQPPPWAPGRDRAGDDTDGE
jgi:hypothetical protein